MTEYINWYKWYPIVRSLIDKGMDFEDISEETGINVGAIRGRFRGYVQRQKLSGSDPGPRRKQKVAGKEHQDVGRSSTGSVEYYAGTASRGDRQGSRKYGQ